MQSIVIRPVTKFEVLGNVFDTQPKAVDHVESMVHDLVKQFIQNAQPHFSFYASQSIPITNFLLKNRHTLARLLAYELEGEFDDPK